MGRISIRNWVGFGEGIGSDFNGGLDRNWKGIGSVLNVNWVGFGKGIGLDLGRSWAGMKQIGLPGCNTEMPKMANNCVWMVEKDETRSRETDWISKKSGTSFQRTAGSIAGFSIFLQR